MTRFLAPLCLLTLLTGCYSGGDIVVGRANGRDIVVTAADIQKRIDERGVSRAVALRELRREQETKAAIELQRKWKSSDNAYVEAAKSSSRTDQPDSPNEEAIAEQIAEEQKRRANARTARYEEEAVDDEEDHDDRPPTEEDEDVVSKMMLPEQRANFENAPNTDGWKTLP